MQLSEKKLTVKNLEFGTVTAISFLYQSGLVLVGNAVAQRLSRWQYARLVATCLFWCKIGFQQSVKQPGHRFDENARSSSLLSGML